MSESPYFINESGSQKLDSSALALMTGLSLHFKSKFRSLFDIDPFTFSDPSNRDTNYVYYLFLDRQNVNNIVAIIAIDKSVKLKESVWNLLCHNDVIKYEIDFNMANRIKLELMPKPNNNSYPFRNDGKIIGYAIFAMEICDLKR